MGVGVAKYHHKWSRTFSISAYDEAGAATLAFSFNNMVGSAFKASLALLWYVVKCTTTKLRLFTKCQALIGERNAFHNGREVPFNQSFAAW